MTFAEPFDDTVLPPDHRAALETSCTVLVDDFLDDAGAIAAAPHAWDQTYLSSYLPRRLHEAYTPVFTREFLVTTVVVGWKLADGNWRGVACLGEMLALNALVESAAIRLESEGIEPDFAPFMRRALTGAEHAELFADAPGGVDESELGRRLEQAGLPVERWFTPFTDVPEPALHPYLIGPIEFDEVDEEYEEETEEE
ncbi:MAG TPA: hypothetical protein VFN57_09840 [Thermomicrobiaceae bacterium]|nr:hypothetical protein [Thermomicrobiaceae bacterium]